jgi:hypothetical protein
VFGAGYAVEQPRHRVQETLVAVVHQSES